MPTLRPRTHRFRPRRPTLVVLALVALLASPGMAQNGPPGSAPFRIASGFASQVPAGPSVDTVRVWDNAVGTNTPGQSGDPDDPHYRDLFKLWAVGEYFPVFYSRAKVESVTGSRQQLVPAR